MLKHVLTFLYEDLWFSLLIALPVLPPIQCKPPVKNSQLFYNQLYWYFKSYDSIVLETNLYNNTEIKYTIKK